MHRHHGGLHDVAFCILTAQWTRLRWTTGSGESYPCGGKKSGSRGFFIGGDLNIELKLCLDEHRGLDSIEWYGMYGPAR